MFERDGAAFKPPASYPRRALVAWSTHDLPTLAGWWREDDLDTREKLGILGGEELAAQRRDRKLARAALLEALEAERLVKPGSIPPDGALGDDLAFAVQRFLANTPASVMVVQMEDVLGVVPQANLPGTVDEHPNWKRKLPVPVEELRAPSAFQAARARAGRRARTLAQEARRAPRPGEGAHPARDLPRPAARRVHLPDASRLAPYLAKLGVSHMYCSPYLKARPGSKHGYDIIDHGELNPEIGTRADFDAFVDALRHNGLAQVMDIVPNHMGVLAADNAWWQDVLENGPASVYANSFDIEWSPTAEHLTNRVLLPVLADHYGIELAAGKLVLGFDPATGAFAITYFEHRLPIDPREYPRILGPAIGELEAAGGGLSHQAAVAALRHGSVRAPPGARDHGARGDRGAQPGRRKSARAGSRRSPAPAPRCPPRSSAPSPR
jgi:(1->4)-alpha-D-glucan 1-alpha-D-glucosylmutase